MTLPVADFIPHPMPEVPANIRENLEDEKWPHASDEERRYISY